MELRDDPAAIDHLVLAAHRGDEQAFHRLVVELQRELRLFVAARACAADQVEEVVQSSFITAYHKLGSYEARGTFLSWLKGIAHNHLRADRRARSRREQALGDELDCVLADSAGSEDPGPSDADLWQVDRLRECLQRLSPTARSLVEQRYVQNLTIGRLAMRFKKNKQALSSALLRIRKSLRSCIEAGGLPDGA